MAGIVNLIGLGLAMVLVPFYRDEGDYGWVHAKFRVLLILAACLLAAGLWAGLPGGQSTVFWLWMCFAGAQFLSTVLAGPETGAPFEHVMLWAALGCFLAAAGALPGEVTAILAAVPASFVALYGLFNRFVHRDPLNEGCDNFLKKRKATSCLSFLGNTNHLSAYLVPCFFLGLYAAATVSLLFLAFLVPVWLAIGLTECRAGWLATITGLGVAITAMNPPLGLVALLFILSAFVISLHPLESTVGRWFYILEAWRMFKEHPLLGGGAQAFRRRHFHVQAELNKRDPSILGTPLQPAKIDYPVAEHSHNEYAEAVVSGGLLSLGLLVAFAAAVILRAMPGNPFILGGLTAVFVHALFFYNISLAASGIPLMALAGIAAPAAGAVLTVPWYAAAAGTAVLLAIAVRKGVRPLRAGRLYHRSRMSKKPAAAIHLLRKAMKLDPVPRGGYLYHATLVSLAQDLVAATSWAGRMIDFYDGEKILWVCWDLYARILRLNNSYMGAKRAFEKALELKPYYGPALQGLAEVDQLISQIRKAIDANRREGAELERRPDKPAINL